MDLKVFHDTVRNLANVEQNGFIPPGEIDNYAHRAQMWLFNGFVDVYAKTQKLDDALSPFSTKFTITTGGDGILLLPKTEGVDPYYEHLLSVYNQYTDTSSNQRTKRIAILNEGEVGDRLDSQTLQPTNTDPIGIEEAPGRVQLYPQVALSTFGYYLRRPIAPNYAFTQIGRTVTYNQGGSTQFAWNESSMNKILIKTLQLMGVPMNDEMLIQYTELKNGQDI